MATPSTALTCMPWNEFVQNPHVMYGLFRRGRGHDPVGVAYDPNLVTLLTGKERGENGRVFHVDTFEELVAVKEKFKSRPLVMKVAAHCTNTQREVIFRVRTHYNDTLAVFVNTAHRKIASIMDTAFNEAAEKLLKEEKFCIEFDFEEPVATWYESVVTKKPGIHWRDGSKATDTRVYVTNHTPYKHCFDCNALWCFCFPFWLFTAPCYFLHRNSTCEDKTHRIPNLPVAYRTELPNAGPVDILREGRRDTDRLHIMTDCASSNYGSTTEQPQPIFVQSPGMPPPYTDPQSEQQQPPQQRNQQQSQQQNSHLQQQEQPQLDAQEEHDAENQPLLQDTQRQTPPPPYVP